MVNWRKAEQAADAAEEAAMAAAELTRQAQGASYWARRVRVAADHAWKCQDGTRYTAEEVRRAEEARDYAIEQAVIWARRAERACNDAAVKVNTAAYLSWEVNYARRQA